MMARVCSAIWKLVFVNVAIFLGGGRWSFECILCFCHVLLSVWCSFMGLRGMFKFYFVHFVRCFSYNHFKIGS